MTASGFTPAVAEAIAADLVRAMRGSRSQSEFSRRLGYRSNIVHRWEGGKCWPTAATFLTACQRSRPALAQCFESFFRRKPVWLDARQPFSAASIAAFLRDLRGKAPLLQLAQRSGYNRYSVGRWLRGSAEPKLPEFLGLIEASSRRALDFIATLTDPTRMATVSARWQQLQRARSAAYDLPWSHAVLRALELEGYQGSAAGGEAWLAARLGLEQAEVERALQLLSSTGQIVMAGGKWRPHRQLSVDTRQDPQHSRQLKGAWTSVALERLRAGAPGSFGYSVFAVSQADLRRLRELQLEYVRAMQSVIAASAPGQCVGLYCAQLLDLSTLDNALSVA
jgi:transcriptional regulator with XRE-family HTH domain